MRSALISRCPEGLTIPHDGCLPEGWPLVEQALLSIAGDADMTPALKARLLDLARGSSYSQIAHAYGIEDGTKFLPPPPSYLPEDAIASIPPGYLDVQNPPNPFALVCPSTGEVYRAALSYTIPSANGPPGEFHILRVFDPTPDFSTTVSASHITTVRVGERDAVLIDTSTPAGLGLPGIPSVTFVLPEPQGYLAVTSQGVPADEVSKVAGSLTMEDQ